MGMFTGFLVSDLHFPTGLPQRFGQRQIEDHEPFPQASCTIPEFPLATDNYMSIYGHKKYGTLRGGRLASSRTASVAPEAVRPGRRPPGLARRTSRTGVEQFERLLAEA